MIVWMILLILALAVGAGLAYGLGVDAGYVLFAWQNWTLESTLAGFVLLVGVTLLALWLLLRLTSGVIELPGWLRGWAAERREQNAHRNFVRGLRTLVTGDPRTSELALLRGVADHDAADLRYAAAARAAQLQGAYDRRNEYLGLGLALESPPAETVLAEQITLLAGSGELEKALEAARTYVAEYPRSGLALQRLAECLDALDRHAELYALLREHGRLLKVEVRLPLAIGALASQLEALAATGDRAAMKTLWDEAKPEWCNDARSQRAYALGLARVGAESEAVAVIDRALKSRWDAALVRCFGQLDSIDPVAQLASIEQWMQRYGEEAELLIAAGLTCMRNRLWGKAGSYLEAAVAAGPTPAAYWHLGQLAERTQKGDAAVDWYRKGLDLAQRTAS